MLNMLWKIKTSEVSRKWKCLIWPLLHFYTVLLIRAGPMNSKISALGQSCDFSIFLLDLQSFHNNFTSFSASISTRTSGDMGTLQHMNNIHWIYVVLCVFFDIVCLLHELSSECCSDYYECGIGWVKLANVLAAAGLEWRVVMQGAPVGANK